MANQAEVNAGSSSTRPNMLPSGLSAAGNPDISLTILEPDLDSGWGDGTSSDTDRLRNSTSAAESTTDFHFQHGRRYHSNQTGRYELPNDESEQSRLNLQHHIYKRALDGRLFTAPLPKEQIRNVLDIGTGTGIWCISAARALPQAQVEGWDLSPIQPKDAPPNCTFTIRDANGDWPAQDKTYDLIHTAAMTLGITDWPRLMRQAYDSLTPGGYLECHEYLGRTGCLNPPTTGPDAFAPYMVQLMSFMGAAMASTGRDFYIAENFEPMLKDAGFVDVEVTYQDWPVGSWAKGAKNQQIGQWMEENFTDAAYSGGKILVSALGWSVEDHKKWAQEMEKDNRSHRWYTYTRVYFVVARKPVNE